MTQYSLAIAARDEGIRRVLGSAPSEWLSAAKAEIMQMPSTVGGKLMTGEDLRHYIVDRIGPAHHNNVFGALTKFGIRYNVLIPTNQYVQMRDKQSHARRSALYEVRSV